MVLAIAVGFLVRIGLKDGFQPYELPALGAALLLPIVFVLFGIPVGLAANLVVATLILRRAGSWWRRQPDESGAVAVAV
jgi:arabinofuranan 3-O-arabinosyltransferase